MKVISVENVSKKFILAHTRPRNLADAARNVFLRSEREDFWALKDVSFEVEQGEALGIIGHNGAGKSTMLKLLTRIMEPTSGRIRTRGRVSALIEVGAGFHPEMTGRENVYLNGSILGMTRREIDSKFDEIVAFAELEKFIDTPVKRYSSGMYARLGFAVIAHLEPEILLVDEVLSVGDERFQFKCQERMASLMSSGATVVFVSHNLPAVAGLCRRSILFHHGTQMLEGDSDDAIRQYRRLALDFGERAGGIADMGHSDQPVRIEEIRVVNRHGERADRVATNEPIDIEADLHVYRDIECANFGLEIARDGFRCFVATSAMDGFMPSLPTGRHKLVFHVDKLSLLEGVYGLSLCVMDRTEATHYCNRYHALHFAVECDRLYRGVANLSHEWSITN